MTHPPGRWAPVLGCLIAVLLPAASGLRAQTATALRFVQEPTDVAVGEHIDPAVTVEAVDASGNRVASFTSRVNVDLLSNPGGASLGGRKQDDPLNGLAIFDNLSVNLPGEGYTLRATASGLASATSAAFDAGDDDDEDAVRLAFGQQPTNALAGATISPAVTVLAVDSDGETDTSFGGTITIAKAAGPSSGQLQGTLTRPAASGIAMFDDLSLELAGTYTLSAASSPLTGATSATFTIAPGPPSGATSEITADPASIPADGSSTSTIAVLLRDEFGNPLVTGGNAVTLSTDRGTLGPVSDRGDGTYTAPLASSTSAGTATVSGTIGGAGIDDAATVEFSQVGSPTLVMDVQPADTPVNQPILPEVVVRVTDGLGSTLTDFSGSVAANLATNPTGATLSGNRVEPVQNGVARFDDLRINRPGTGYRLAFTSPGAQGTTSAAFAVTAGTASPANSRITADPTSIPADGSSTSTITVLLIDANGEPLTTGGDTVTLSTTLGTVGPVTDRGNGIYTATLTSITTPGAATVTGTVNGATIGDTETVTFAAGSADVEVEVSVSDDSPTVGDDIAYIVTVRNGGPETATGVQLAQEIPPRLALASAITSQGDYDPATGVWSVGSLATDARATLTLVLTVTGEGSN
ncbi:MAG: invasin domain 3-containing protein [Gemmatimonadota bacterium]